MYDKIFEQAENVFKPIGEIVALQAQTFEAISQKQSELANAFWGDSLSYAQNVFGQKSADGMFKVQQEYFEGINKRVQSVTEESMDLLSSANEKMSALMQGSLPVPDLNPFVQAVPAAAATSEEPKASPKKSASPDSSKHASSKPASKAGRSSGKSDGAAAKAKSTSDASAKKAAGASSSSSHDKA